MRPKGIQDLRKPGREVLFQRDLGEERVELRDGRSAVKGWVAHGIAPHVLLNKGPEFLSDNRAHIHVAIRSGKRPFRAINVPFLINDRRVVLTREEPMANGLIHS